MQKARTGVINDAHAAGFKVYAYTFCNDSSLCGLSDPANEFVSHFRLRVDGVFTDFPDTVGAARDSVVPEASTVVAGLVVVLVAGSGLMRRWRR